ncbi:MAG TPA: ABC transporter permease [Gemmatimonadaceae bacterium]
MGRRFAARLGSSIVVTYVVATIAFFVIRATPGEPFAYDGRPLRAEVKDRLRKEAGYDQPLVVQYGRYLANVSRGKFGWSHSKQQYVGTLIADALPRTLLLAGLSLVLSIVVGSAIGVLQATRGGWFDRGSSGVLLFFYSLPDFWGALMILTIFSAWLPLLPSGNIVDAMHEYMSGGQAFVDRIKHLVLPVASLTVLSLAGIARYQRAAMLDVLPADFVRTARAKGVSEHAVVWRHALRNALTPMITILGLTLPAFLGGVVFIERVFNWPGLGMLATGAIASSDYDLVTGTVFVGAVIVIIGNLLSDLLQMTLDPRIRE